MTKKLVFISTLFVFCSCFGKEPTWVNLFPPNGKDDIMKYSMEMQSCKKKDSTQRDQCEKKIYTTLKEWTFDVFEKPQESSKKIGVIYIKMVPSTGNDDHFHTSFRKIDEKNKIDFLSTDYDPYAGDYPHLDFSVLDVKDDWVQFPKNPFPKPVWMKVPNDFKDENTFRKLVIRWPYRLPNGEEIIFTKIDKNSAIYRKFNHNDMLCGNDPIEVPAEDLVERTMKFKDMYDKDGHLILKIAYTRGC